MAKKSIPAGSMQAILFLVLVCFFLSGLSSLIYQVLWTKMIVKIIGSAPFAVAIVLTIFMGGLGLGSFLAARIIDSVKEPARLVRMYGLLELAVGAYALIIPFLLKIFRPLYAVLYNHLYDRFLLYNFLTFLGCSIILCLPVVCMGATLPVLCRFYVRRLSHLGTHAGRLYGLNTIGAALGALLCGFWLIKFLGVWQTLIAAVGINIFIAIASFIAGARIQADTIFFKESLSEQTRPSHTDFTDSPPQSSFAVKAALMIFGVSGFCAMAYEVIWTRLLGLLVGPTTYSFTIVLVSFITGLALGSIIFGFFADRVKNVLLLLLATQIATALSALVVSQLLGDSQLFFAKLIFTFQNNFVLHYFLKALALFAFLILPTMLSGATFPLVGKICTRSIENIGKSLGFAYVVNTIGAVAGSFCAGFIILPLLGKENSLSFVIGLQLFTAMIIAVFAAKNSFCKYKPLFLAATSAFGIGMCFFFPFWNRHLIAAGMYHRFDKIDMILRTTGWFETFLRSSQDRLEEGKNLELVYYGDGIGGFTTVFKSADEFGNLQYSMANSGKFDASSRYDMPTQTLLAHFPMLFHPNPKNVMVLGLASGITAGETLCYPIEKLDVVDISQQVVEASHFFDPWNNNVLANPKTKLIVQDGRAHLYLTNQKYDVIISEPSNPWMAGMADLFTRDLFAQARDRLNDNGILCQWVHAYQMDWNTFALICRTFADVFPNNLLVHTMFAQPIDYLLIGFKGENKLNLSYTVEKLPYIRQSKNIILSDPRVLYPLIVSEDIEQIVGQGPLNTDNNPRLEFEAQRTMYYNDPRIAINIGSRKFLTQETKNIIEQILADVNLQINLTEFLLSIYTPAFDLVNLQKATPIQQQRLFELIDTYCANNPLNLSQLPPEQLGQRCRSVQIEALKSKVGTVLNTAESYSYLSTLYAQEGLLDEAVVAAKKAIELRPNLYSGYTALGNLFTRQDKLKEAEDCFRKALQITPRDFQVHNALGITLAKQSKYDEAIRHFEEAVRLNPNFAEAHANLGHALLEQKKLDEAITHLTLSTKLDPNKPAVHNNLALAFGQKGQFDNAVFHYRQAIRIKPDWAIPANSLAWLLAVKKNTLFYNPKEAVFFAQQACKLTNDSEPAILDTLAVAYAANGQFTEAVDTAQKALNLARSLQQNEIALEIEKHLNLFRVGQPYVETSS